MKELIYYLWSARKRKELDILLEKNKKLYKGVVLDIGGRDRGKFEKPKDKVKKWIFADIVKEHHPDIILDVTDMRNVKNKSIDVISALELFEHVLEIEKGIAECYRVLQKKGTLIMSVPFIYPVHGDPYDFQRWTLTKWLMELKKQGFTVKKKVILGRYFAVLADMNKMFVNSLPFGLRHLLMLTFPFYDVLSQLDHLPVVQKHEKLGNMHNGYFIVAQKP